MGFMNVPIFTRDYELKVVAEFAQDGRSAGWAPLCEGPRFWGEEDMLLETPLNEGKERSYPAGCVAVSHDSRLLAVSTENVIRIYDLRTREVACELQGHVLGIRRLVFAPRSEAGSGSVAGGYCLLAESSVDSSRRSPAQLAIWELDDDGKLRSHLQNDPLPIEMLAKKALASILPDLEREHNVSGPEFSELEDTLSATLRKIELSHQLDKLRKRPGHYPTLSPSVFSPSGRKFICVTQNHTTQHQDPKPPAEQLPQIHIVDFTSLETVQTLRGHTDQILGAAFSPVSDGRIVATASWDSTCRIWDTETGKCLHTISPSEKQKWGVQFSPDGSKVLLSDGEKTAPLGLYDVQTGEQIVSLTFAAGEVRRGAGLFAWAPDGDYVAVLQEQRVLLWSPSSGSGGKLETLIQLENDGSLLEGFCRFSQVFWAAEGRILVARCSDGTIFVYDHKEGVKWRFQRPKGRELEALGGRVEYLEIGAKGTVASLDGDGKVRLWEL